MHGRLVTHKVFLRTKVIANMQIRYPWEPNNAKICTKVHFKTVKDVCKR